MKISLNEIKKYVPEAADIDTGELIRLIGARLVEVEGAEDWGQKYSGIYAVKVLTCEDIPDTHLHLCQIDAGPELNKKFATSTDQSADHSEKPGHASPTRGADSSDASSPTSAQLGTTRSKKAKSSLISTEQESHSPETPTSVQVVCGAPNVHAGMWAIWIAPGSIVPSTYGGENFQLGARKLRGYLSHGMLAALDELALGTDHDGIAELGSEINYNTPDCINLAPGAPLAEDISLAPNTSPAEGTGLVPGTPLAELFDLNDIILEIENKSLTHRPDTFGLVGFAREVAGILGVKFTEPGWIASEPNVDITPGNKKSASAQPCPSLSVKIADPALCPRYSCAVMDLPATQQSPYLTPSDIFLAKAGMRSISPVVDLTNIMMLRTGQPLHAFDYDKLVKVGGGGIRGKGAIKDGAEIGVRAAHPGEKLELLDGKTIECAENDILITSGDIPVALAGAMGGKNTEIDDSTRRIVLESATFSLYHLRKTQMHHGIFSEAITRFTKGQPAGMTLPVLMESARLLGGEVLEVADDYPEAKPADAIEVTTSGINRLLGTDYDTDLVIKTLENVGFTIEKSASGSGDSPVADTLRVTPPLWRTDIHIPEDITEEVGRLNGYDNIPQTLPTRPFRMVRPQPLLQLKTRLRSILSDQLGMHEVLTYSFVSGRLLGQVGEDPDNSYKIVNSISPELQYFRQSLAPSLLSKIPQNLKAGYKDFAIYELNQVSEKRSGLMVDDTEPVAAGAEAGVPVMQHRLAIVAMQDYYTVKSNLLTMADRLGIALEFREFSAKNPPELDKNEKVCYNGRMGAKSHPQSSFSDNSPHSLAAGKDNKKMTIKNHPEGSVSSDPSRSLANDKDNEKIEVEDHHNNEKNSAFSTLTDANLPYLEHLRSATIFLNGQKIGEIGEVKTSVLKNFKIKETVTAAELLISPLLNSKLKHKTYDLSKYPTVTRDLTLKIIDISPKKPENYAAIAQNLNNTLKKAKLAYTLTPVSIYRPLLGGYTNYSFRITLTSYEKTLDTAEISGIMERVESAARKVLGAEVV